MNRRRVLAGVTAGLAAGVAGCLGGVVGGGSGEDSDPAEATGTVTASGSIAQHGYPADICATEIIDDFSIRAIVDPAFADDWTGVEVDPKYHVEEESEGLADSAAVIGVTDGDRARAYPVIVVWWHEIVNDTFGTPLMVTFCSICQSGMVAKRLVDGSPTVFGVSGQLWRPPDLYKRASAAENRSFGSYVKARNGTVNAELKNSGNLVMFDRATRSFWSQILARAICGPQAGTPLEMTPFTLTTWAEWKRRHPGTDVLLPPPHSTLME